MEKLYSSVTRSTVLGITRLAANTRRIPYMGCHFEGLTFCRGENLKNPAFSIRHSHRLRFCCFLPATAITKYDNDSEKFISTDFNRSYKR